jgi:hypothetical protein
MLISAVAQEVRSAMAVSPSKLKKSSALRSRSTDFQSVRSRSDTEVRLDEILKGMAPEELDEWRRGSAAREREWLARGEIEQRQDDEEDYQEALLILARTRRGQMRSDGTVLVGREMVNIRPYLLDPPALEGDEQHKTKLVRFRPGGDPSRWRGRGKLSLLSYLVEHQQSAERKSIITKAAASDGGSERSVRRNLELLATAGWLSEGKCGTCLTEQGIQKARNVLKKSRK